MEQLGQLRALICSIPMSLRSPLRQPCLGLFLEDTVWRKKWLSDLEHGLRRLSQEAWIPHSNEENTDERSDEYEFSAVNVVFANYALIRPANDRHADDLRVRFWHGKGPSGGHFSLAEHFINARDLVATLVERPQSTAEEQSGMSMRFNYLTEATLFSTAFYAIFVLCLLALLTVCFLRPLLTVAH